MCGAKPARGQGWALNSRIPPGFWEGRSWIYSNSVGFASYFLGPGSGKFWDYPKALADSKALENLNKKPSLA